MENEQPTNRDHGRVERHEQPDPMDPRETLWNRLVKKHTLPLKETVSLYELQELDEGRRWAPDRNPALFSDVEAMTAPRGSKKVIARNLPYVQGLYTSQLMEKKLAFYLLSIGKPPLIKVLPGRYQTVFYLLFCLMSIDPKNYTLWQIDPYLKVDGEFQAETFSFNEKTYIQEAFRAKKLAADRINAAAVPISRPGDKNNTYMLLKYSLELHAATIRADYDQNAAEKLPQIMTTIATKVTDLCAHLKARTDVTADLRDNYISVFNENWWIAYQFDPLYPRHQEASFSGQLGRQVFRLYERFTEASEVLDLQHDQVLREEHRRQQGIVQRENVILPRPLDQPLEPARQNQMSAKRNEEVLPGHNQTRLSATKHNPAAFMGLQYQGEVISGHQAIIGLDNQSLALTVTICKIRQKTRRAQLLAGRARRLR